MKERVESRGGKLVVESRLGEGTTVAAKVPLRVGPV
jgi:signal transduction histidine kinase